MVIIYGIPKSPLNSQLSITAKSNSYDLQKSCRKFPNFFFLPSLAILNFQKMSIINP